MKIWLIPMDQRIVGILTKSLVKGKFKAFKDKLGLVHNPFTSKRECYEISFGHELPHRFVVNVQEVVRDIFYF
jgi:hypothetical protein